jgi:hypothetical protein
MKISSVRSYLLSYPFTEPIRLPFHGGERTILKRDAMFIRVETDNGLVGYAPGPGSERVQREIEHTIAPFLLDRVLADPDALRVLFMQGPGVDPESASDIWYNKSQDGAPPAQGSILGLSGPGWMGQVVYPHSAIDANGRIYLAYRNEATGEGKISIVTNGAFAEPITFTSAKFFFNASRNSEALPTIIRLGGVPKYFVANAVTSAISARPRACTRSCAPPPDTAPPWAAGVGPDTKTACRG